MDERTYKLIGADYPGNRAEDVINPGLGWMIGFLFVVSFLGLFSLTPLRKVAFNVINTLNIIVTAISARYFKIAFMYAKNKFWIDVEASFSNDWSSGSHLLNCGCCFQSYSTKRLLAKFERVLDYFSILLCLYLY